MDRGRQRYAGRVDPAGGGVTYHYASADPVATYLATLAIGNYTKLSATGPGGLPVTSWLRTGKDEALAPAVEDPGAC